MATALQVAEWFLARSKRDNDFGYDGELISNLKLQKLLYYAQGCTLAITGAPLFDDPIEAWEHGPVVPIVYHRYKQNGRNGIEYDSEFDTSVFTDEQREILESVYLNFGQFSAWKLRDMTHEEAPWQKTPKNSVISNDLIRDYFKERYVE